MTEEEMFEIAREASLQSKSSSSSKNKKPFKKLSEEERRDRIRLGLLKKKESESKALELVEKLLEQSIDRTWFESEALQSLNETYYKDVVDERSVLKLCGYPLCSQGLPKVIPNQKYRIVANQKKVYDLTERKKFCSNTCFNASSYILTQLDNDPLWLREAPSYKSSQIIKILVKNNPPSHGSEIPLLAQESSDIGDTKSFCDPKSHENHEEELEKELEDTLPDVEELLQSMNINEVRKEPPISKIKAPVKKVSKEMSPSQIIASRLKEWCTTETLRYLKGDDFVWSCLVDNHYGADKILSVLGENPNLPPESLISFNKLITSDIAQNKVTESFEPSYDPMDNMKIMAFLRGETEIRCDEESAESMNCNLPKGLSRTQIVWNQLDSVLPELLSLFGLQSSDVKEDVSTLIRGFYLTPSNIVFSKHEWTLVALLVLEVIREKNVRLRTILKSRDAKKYLNMLLLNFDLEEKSLSSMVQNAVGDINLLVNKSALMSICQ